MNVKNWLKVFVGWIGSGRDWFVESIGGVKISRLLASQQSFQQNVVANKKFFAEMQTEWRNSLKKSNEAWATVLACMALDPSALHLQMSATRDEAYAVADKWSDEATRLSLALTVATEKADKAYAVGNIIEEAFQWLPLDEESVNLTLPEPPVVSE